MPLAEEVQEVFAPGGLLARADAQFRPRGGQTRMAVAVARTMEEGGMLVVEAGTGVGKTFSYLVPALLSGERVLLSTATKALQDQLFARDLPLLAGVLGVPVRAALLKGRASYLCLHRMAQARQDAGVNDRNVERVLAKVEDWSRSTRSGDLAELTGLDERSPVIPLVTSTRENCLGASCPRARECHVNLARREALAADVVVINHHLFFADMAVRESGVAELLPTVRVVVFDEAHQISETGVQFLGLQLSTGQLLDFGRDLLAAGLLHARGLADWVGLAARLEAAVGELRLGAGSASAQGKRGWAGAAPEAALGGAWEAALRRLSTACAQVQEALDLLSETAPDLERLYERSTGLLARLARFAGPCAQDAVRWVDLGTTQVRMVESPLDIAHAMRTRFLTQPAQAPGADEWPDPEGERARAWVFTSATLGTDEGLTWFVERCGLEGAEVLRVDSPFDYASQAALYVPRHLPKPADPGHSAAIARLAGDAAARIGGRTLVLTTTLKALVAIGDALHRRFGDGQSLEVLVQGEWPKRRLMERFREGAGAGDGAQRGCVLVASATFWEGFDVPGDALQLVIIDKLPFPPPGDPLVEARSQRIEEAGGSSFQQYAVPEAAVALKQGAGRLIRRESDRGVLVVGDTRLATMGYGKRLLRALPPMRRLETPEDFDAALDGLLTRTSTTDPTCP
jgi:ATP-dependent DNA helicase DinG